MYKVHWKDNEDGCSCLREFNGLSEALHHASKLTCFSDCTPVSEVYVGYLGDSIQKLYIFVIESNGSIYYSNVFNGIYDIKSHEFNNLELVKDVKGITKMFNAKAYKGDIFTYTMLGVLKDGSYYDMSLIIK